SGRGAELDTEVAASATRAAASTAYRTVTLYSRKCRALSGRSGPAVHDGDRPAVLVGRDRPAGEDALLDVEDQGALDPVLQMVLCPDLDVDPVPAGHERKLVDRADEPVGRSAVVDVPGAADRAAELRHRMTEVVVDDEAARRAGKEAVELEGERGRR